MKEEIYINIGKKPVNLYVSWTIRQLYLNLGKVVVLRAMGGDSIANAIHTVSILKADKVIKPEIKIEIGMEANHSGYKTATISIQVKSVIEEGDFYA